MQIASIAQDGVRLKRACLINYAKRTKDVASVLNRIGLGRMGAIEREGLVMKTFLSEQSSNRLSTQIRRFNV